MIKVLFWFGSLFLLAWFVENSSNFEGWIFIIAWLIIFAALNYDEYYANKDY